MRQRFISCLIRLSPINLMLGFWELGPASPHGYAQLQGGISTQEQLDTSDIHVSQLILDIDHSINVIGSGLRRDAAGEAWISASVKLRRPEKSALLCPGFRTKIDQSRP